MKSDHAHTEPCALILYELVGEVLARGERQQEIERLHAKLLQRRAEYQQTIEADLRRRRAHQANVFGRRR